MSAAPPLTEPLGWWGRLTNKWAIITQTECIFKWGSTLAWRLAVREGFPEEVAPQLKSEGGARINYLEGRHSGWRGTAWACKFKRHLRGCTGTSARLMYRERAGGSEEPGALCPFPPQGLSALWPEPMFRSLSTRSFCGQWQIHLNTVSIHIMQSYWTQPRAREGWIEGRSRGRGWVCGGGGECMGSDTSEGPRLSIFGGCSPTWRGVRDTHKTPPLHLHNHLGTCCCLKSHY